MLDWDERRCREVPISPEAGHEPHPNAGDSAHATVGPARTAHE
jgi:hypothetical protein